MRVRPPPLPPSRARTSAGPGIQAGREEEGADLFLFRTNGGTEDIHDYFFGGGRGTQQKCFTQSFHQWKWSEMLFWVPYLSRGITQRMRNSGSNICTAQPYRAGEALTSPVGWHHSLLLLFLWRPPPPKTFRPFRLRRAGAPPYVLQIVRPTTSLVLKLRNNASCSLYCYTTLGRKRSSFRRRP